MVGDVGFLAKPFNFWKISKDRSKTGNFSFIVAGVNVIGLGGRTGMESL